MSFLIAFFSAFWAASLICRLIYRHYTDKRKLRELRQKIAWQLRQRSGFAKRR